MADKPKIITNPHDRFFKKVFSDPDKARDFIVGTLEPTLIQRVDLSTLSLDNTSYIDEKLSQYYSDLVYNCVFGKQTNLRIAFLFEHKSYVPDYPHLQLLRYMLSIWEHNIETDESFSPIIPIIVYHGRGAWKTKSFNEYFTGGEIDPVLEKYIPQFDYWLTDMYQMGLVEIQQNYSLDGLRISLAIMKHVFDPKVEDKLLQIFDGVQRLVENEAGKSLIHSIVLYLLRTTDVKLKQIKEVMKELGVQDLALPGSTAWKMIEERNIEIVKNAIQEGVSNELISKITDISVEAIEELRKELD